MNGPGACVRHSPVAVAGHYLMTVGLFHFQAGRQFVGRPCCVGRNTRLCACYAVQASARQQGQHVIERRAGTHAHTQAHRASGVSCRWGLTGWPRWEPCQYVAPASGILAPPPVSGVRADRFPVVSAGARHGTANTAHLRARTIAPLRSCNSSPWPPRTQTQTRAGNDALSVNTSSAVLPFKKGGGELPED